MKKFLTIMLIAITAVMLSSCIIVTKETPVPTYTMYFSNDTKSHVYDWFLKDKDDNNYTISDEYCEVASGTSAAMTGLYEKYYQVWFCLLSTRTQDVYLYTKNYVLLDEDTIFHLSDYSFTSRSVLNADNSDSEKHYVLRTSDGQEFELETIIKEK